jgi:nitrilase
MATDDPRHAANASLVYDPKGRSATRYDKIHLFRFDNGRESYDEAAVLKAGDTPVAFDLHDHAGHDWRVGMSVCYDLRFAELYQRLAAQVLLVPAAFTHTTGHAHWEVLLRARAIENQAYVIASAQGGLHENGRRTWGHSMVIDPWGQVLALQAEGPGVVLADIDMDRLQAVRTQLPALQHRRLI